MSRRKRKDLTEAQLEVEAPPEEAMAPAVGSPSSAAPASGGEAEDRSLESELERLSAEASEMRELAQRKQAEFENYRKRMERERMDLARYAGADVVKEVLPVLDNLERALRASGSASEAQLRDGVAIIHRQLQEILTRLGLTEVESEGKPFDPHIHEAVSQIETGEHPDGTVLTVFQKGYLFKDRLLRPALVSVARASSRGGE
ncbi:MAG TPA: nucleotide exchange factor GrpE, partial [Vicinamibacteria bacterium]